MTRFARAKGSKSSNERTPNEAMSWGEMKQQLLDKNQEVENAQKKKELDAQRTANYKSFLEDLEVSKSKDIKWADFSENVTKPDKTMLRKVVESVPILDDENDDAPTEISSKIQQPEIVVRKKSKNKANKPIKIEKIPENQPKQGVKRKREGKTKIAAALPLKVVKPESELTDKDKRKLEKKAARKIRQIEKRKKIKEEKKRQAGVDFVPQPPARTFDQQPSETIVKPMPPPKQEKKPKQRLQEKSERRKYPENSMIVNGREVAIAYVDGFPIKKEDAERIHLLRKQMISKGLPRSEIKIALKLERRKAEKAFTREKKKVCFYCRKNGHNLSECPEVGKHNEFSDTAATGICFKCGSTEHTHFECKVVRGQEFKFAECFICHEQGHIAKQCPDNARGLYPKGGACRVCGDVTHLKRDCPQFQAQQANEQNNLQIETLDGSNPDNLDASTTQNDAPKTYNKIIKF